MEGKLLRRFNGEQDREDVAWLGKKAAFARTSTQNRVSQLHFLPTSPRHVLSLSFYLNTICPLLLEADHAVRVICEPTGRWLIPLGIPQQATRCWWDHKRYYPRQSSNSRSCLLICSAFCSNSTSRRRISSSFFLLDLSLLSFPPWEA